MKFPTVTIATTYCLSSDLCRIALGRIPGFRLDRADIALTGAALMMSIGAIPREEAYRAVNLDILALPRHDDRSGAFATVRLFSAGDELGAHACAFALDFARYCRGDRRRLLDVP